MERSGEVDVVGRLGGSLSCYSFQEPGNPYWEINKRFVVAVLQLADYVH